MRGTVPYKEEKNKASIGTSKSLQPMVETYLDSQVEKLNQLIEGISHETFWQVFPKILGIDAKLTLLTELMPFEDFSNEEIIRIVENDYRDYFKELCGYDLRMKEKPLR
ncbi:TPA: hypothetical protein J0V22_002711 [Enterococcus faecium]|nr:hypothetical protein [Enterococcus faecium]